MYLCGFVSLCARMSVAGSNKVEGTMGATRGAAAPPNFGQLRFFGQQEKIWAKPGLKTFPCFFIVILKRRIFYILF